MPATSSEHFRSDGGGDLHKRQLLDGASHPPGDGELTTLLRAAGKGDRPALNAAFAMVYAELRMLAAAALSRESPGHTLQPTAIANEAYIRLIRQNTADWQDRRQFFGVAAMVMRRILVDHARARFAEKRGGGRNTDKEAGRARHAPPFDDLVLEYQHRAIDLVALDEALDLLRTLDERKCSVVELRFFLGMTMEQVAEMLEVPLRTIERDWMVARAFLRTCIAGESGT